MEILIILLFVLIILIFISILASYNLYLKSEQQRKEITILSQEIAFINKKLEKLK